MEVLIVADWLPTYGGAEHVLAALRKEWPNLPMKTTIAARKRLGPLADDRIEVDPFLQMLFRLTGNHQWLLPFMPRAVERIDCGNIDVLLTSSHAVAKGVVPPPTTAHVCYCHTPMRYAWEMETEYLNDFRLSGSLRRSAERMLSRLRRWDLSTAKRVDVFIANSSETAARIRRIYGRESVVIPPPVDDRFFHEPLIDRSSDDYFLALGRFVPYKRFDLLIELANRHHLRLLIGGTGHDERRLRKLAGPTVTFLGRVPDEQLPALYQRARALLFPQVEDAGIVPMEAQACGTPVIAYGKGGVLDVVEDGVTGLLASEQTVEAFADAAERLRTVAWDRSRIRERARRFHEDRFRERMRREVTSAYERFSSHRSS